MKAAPVLLILALGCDWEPFGDPFARSTRHIGAGMVGPAVIVTSDAGIAHANMQFRVTSSEPFPFGGVDGNASVFYERLDMGSGGGTPLVTYALEYYMEGHEITEIHEEHMTDAGTLRSFINTETVTSGYYPTDRRKDFGILTGCEGKTVCEDTLRFVWFVEDMDGHDRYDFVPTASVLVVIPESMAKTTTVETLIIDDDGGVVAREVNWPD